MVTLYRKDIDTLYRFERTHTPGSIRLTVGEGFGVYYLGFEAALRAVHNIARAGGKILD